MYHKTYTEIIFEICQKHNISIEPIYDTSILKLTYNDSTRYIWSRRFDINSAISAKIADNKFETYKVLDSYSIPVVECIKINRLFTNEYDNSSYSNFYICNEMLNKHTAIVIKPNCSYEGYDVFKCISKKQIEEVIATLYYKYKYIVVSPFINIKSEYRAIFFKGEILLVYWKELPFIISDGEKPLIELLTEKEFRPYIKMFSESELNTIYRKGHKIYLNWKFNLSQGARCSMVNERNLYNKISSLAISAAKAIGINFASVDIIIDVNEKMQILEINAGVAMDQFIHKATNGRIIAASIYEKVIMHMFNL